jgi:hypothetical protein
MPRAKLEKYWAEKAWLRSHGITGRASPQFLRYIYWRDRIRAVAVFLLVAGLIWFFFHTGYL